MARILLVEDDAILHVDYLDRLTYLGHEVLSAHNARDVAMFIERNEYFDIVVCDNQIPYVHGFESAADVGIEMYRLVSSKAENTPEFILHTGDPESDLKVKLAGTNIHYLAKDHSDNLEKMVTELLQEAGVE